MRKENKRFLIAFLICSILMVTTPAFADSIMQKIDVILNGVNVAVDGKEIETNTILYNGVVFVPIRTVSEIFDKDIEWNQEDMTVNIMDKSNKEVNKDEYDNFIKSFDLKETKNVILNDKTYFYVEYLYNKDLSDKKFNDWIKQHEKNMNSYIKNAFDETGTYGVLNLIVEFNRTDENNQKYCIGRAINDNNGLFIEIIK